MLFLPESPRWLVGNNKAREAEEALTRIRGSNVVAAQEVREIEASIEEERYVRTLLLLFVCYLKTFQTPQNTTKGYAWP